MDKLIQALKSLLADSFAFRIKSQYYHWNIVGPDFIQYHDFLGKIYTQVDGRIDEIAEHIRSLGAFAPGSFGRFSELTSIKDEDAIPTAVEMIDRLSGDCKILHSSMIKAHTIAESLSQFGVVNFLEGLIDENEKLQWMLDSITKK